MKHLHCAPILSRLISNCFRFAPALLLLLGVALRLFALGKVPAGMHQDESFVAWNAFALLHDGMDSAGHIMPVYLADWGDGHSALYVWLLMPLIALNSGHVTPFISRLPQAIVAILTLWAVYDLLKRLFNKSLGLWALFLLSTCPWHIMMSRWGLDANLAPGFLIFGLYFFIRGLEQEKFLLLSALFYGLCLYSYAVVWPIVPFMLLLQIIYGLFHHKLRINRCSIMAAVILALLALPLLLFVAVNSEIIPEITLPFLTIPKMNGYRGSEIAFGFSEMWQNLRRTLSLLYHQNIGAPYDILLPYGLFYNIGRLFIILGAVCLVLRSVKILWSKDYKPEIFLFIQLLGGGLVCLLVSAVLHQINALYIPLILCEAYGIYSLLPLLSRIRKWLKYPAAALISIVFLYQTFCFQFDYYTSYKDLVNAYFAAGIEECVDFALAQCEENDIDTISVEKGAQWPRLLLHTETLPSQYLATVEYDVAPAPAAFTTHDGIRIKTRINYDTINDQTIYIIYYTDHDRFQEHFDLTPFYDWYVAVPK